MTHRIKHLGGAAFTILALTIATPMVATMAHAGGADDPAEAKAFLASGMTLADAVSAAEANSGGTAMAAAWEPSEAGATVFEVELAKADGSVATVLVDAQTGAVSKAAMGDDDGPDEDEDRDREDGGEGDDPD
ncbi:PepSY domain-containing protein [Acuticoccus kandeliae]|uniref:PepSY domain-containing protein n=1 Tax=Acuticoccus kandeliae TaxID=2073160 RepID=UPI000D3E1748|nr:PepSY domain-containing protein [Acuticoccus kandeliae]